MVANDVWTENQCLKAGDKVLFDAKDGKDGRYAWYVTVPLFYVPYEIYWSMQL